VSAEEAKQLMEESKSFTLVDVRTRDEYVNERIEGAVLIPHNEIAEKARTELPDQDGVIFVYCSSGMRATEVAQELAGMGYTQVYNMGSILSWPYGTVSG
jgi:rhodanese-related sulfurtransferase